MSVIRIYLFENGAEVKIDNSLYENISAEEIGERIKYAAEAAKKADIIMILINDEAAKKIYSENAEKKKEEKHEE